MKLRKKPTYRKFRYWKARTCKKGENNPVSKISRSVVDYIRENYKKYIVTHQMLADKFGISEKHVRSIVAGRYWPDGRKLTGQQKLTPVQEEAIINLWNSTLHLRQRHPDRWSHRRLAKAFGVSKGLIVFILSGKKKSVKEMSGMRNDCPLK